MGTDAGAEKGSPLRVPKGSTIGLTTDVERVDANRVKAICGLTLLSTSGDAVSAGASGERLEFLAEDLMQHNTGGMLIYVAGGPFTVRDGVSGDGANLIRCNQIESGRKLICVNELVFDGSALGFGGETIDAFSVGGSGVLGDIGKGGELDPPEEDAKLFLPSISR